MPGGCVVCTATIGFALRKHICADLTRLLGITGLQSNVYFCDVPCARVAQGNRIDNPKGQRLIVRLAAWASGLLETDLRVGDKVHITGDQSYGINFEKGDAEIVSICYDHSVSKPIFTCKYAMDGMARPKVFSHQLQRLGTSAGRPPRPPNLPSDGSETRRDSRLEQLEVSIESQRIRAVSAEASGRHAREERDEEAVMRNKAEDDAVVAQHAVQYAERRADRASAVADGALSDLANVNADLQDLESDYAQLTALEARDEAEREALERRVDKLKASDPTELRRLQTQRSVMNADLRHADKKIASLERMLGERDNRIKELEERLAKLPKIWLPHRQSGQGAGRGCPHDGITRLLWAKLLTLRCPPAEISEIFASCAYAILSEHTEELSKMDLPSDNFARNMRPELGALHQTISAITVGQGEIIYFANDASPYDGRELGVTAARVKSLVNGKTVLRDSRLAGCYETADATSKGEALSIKEQCFDR